VSGGRDKHPHYWNVPSGSIGRWLYAQRGLRRRFLSPRCTSPSPPESPETVEEEPERAEPRSSTRDPQTTRVEPEERRGVWSRLFGSP
jgi:hypothetical protein